MSIQKMIPVLAALVLFAVFGVSGALAGEGHEGHEEQAVEAATTPAAQAFERLKALDGTWTGTAQSPEGEAHEGTQTFRVSSAGTVVMETMFPDTEHEMINMYHLDGEDLVMKHYCAGGNQPEMRLSEVSDDGSTLSFDFAGGTNLDPAMDDHIHSASVTIVDQDTVHEAWVGYHQGEAAHTMRLTLERAE